VERRRIVVAGQVQGVFFRDSCRRVAERVGVTGWVRNRPDGTVEAVFQGSADAVGEMIAWARRGPPHAVVESVTDHAEPVGPLDGFTVRPSG